MSEESETYSEVIVDSLKKNSIFSALDVKELIEISSLFEKLDFNNLEFIFMEGDPADWLYIVTQNRVKKIKHNLIGTNIILSIKSPGEMFGFISVISNKSYHTSAQAKGAVSVIRISRMNFLKILKRYSIILTGMTKYISEQLIDVYDDLKCFSARTIECRIISMLLKYSVKNGAENSEFRKIDFSLTRQDIADMVGSTAQTCSRIMSKLQKQGIVKTSRNELLVKADALIIEY